MMQSDVRQQNIRRVAVIVALMTLVILLPACSFDLSALSPASEQKTVVGGGDAEWGAVALKNYGCGSCHSIPGIAGANGMVGPPLDNWADRQYIVGTFPNQPQFLIEWIRFPQAIEPGNVMPNMGVTEQEARDMGAYLYSLSRD